MTLQIDYGDYRLGEESAGRGGGGRLTPPQSHQQLGAVVERFFPRTHREWAPHQAKLGVVYATILIVSCHRELEQRLGDAWCSLRGRTCSECVRIYLNVARKWPFCGSKLFSVKVTFLPVINVQVSMRACIINWHYAIVDSFYSTS